MAETGSASRPGAAVIIAGGQGRRLGGRDKPALLINGRSLLDLALTAAAGGPIVVVGPPRALPVGVLPAVEDPPGGGPAAGVAAGVAALPELPGDTIVAVLAADLPGITASTLARLCAALSDSGPGTAGVAGSDAGAGGADGVGGAVLVDPGGRRQYLIGVWRHAALQRSIGRRDRWHNVSVMELLAPVQIVEIAGSPDEADDIDDPADLQRWQS